MTAARVHKRFSPAPQLSSMACQQSISCFHSQVFYVAGFLLLMSKHLRLRHTMTAFTVANSSTFRKSHQIHRFKGWLCLIFPVNCIARVLDASNTHICRTGGHVHSVCVCMCQALSKSKVSHARVVVFPSCSSSVFLRSEV